MRNFPLKLILIVLVIFVVNMIILISQIPDRTVYTWGAVGLISFVVILLVYFIVMIYKGKIEIDNED